MLLHRAWALVGAVQSAALVNLVTYPRLQLVVTVDERGLIKVWKQRMGVGKPPSCCPCIHPHWRPVTFRGPLLLVSNLALGASPVFQHLWAWHQTAVSDGTSSQALHVADQVILLSPPAPPCLPCGGAGSTSAFSSNMPQPAPWTCLCSLSPSQ